MDTIIPISSDETKRAQAAFIAKVYTWMSFALALTGLVAFFVASTPALVAAIFGSRLVFFALIIGELLLVGYLTVAIQRMSASMATFVFLSYSFLNGLVLSLVFIVYTTGSLASTFFITAGTFGAMSLYGYTTKRDLTSIGNLAFMALIGLIIASVVNMFLHSSALYWITTYAGVLIFVALTAYDTQKIKNVAVTDAGAEVERKGAIMGALALYLDFINLFLFLLRLFGRRK